MGVSEFLVHLPHLRVLFDLLMIAISAGIYIVPLYAIMQHRSEASHRSRVIASNNVLNALFMVVSALGVSWMLAMKFNVTDVFLFAAILNTFIALYICKLLPDAVILGIFRVVLRLLFRVEVKGFENYKKAGDRVIIVANHISMIDAIIIASFLPEKITFTINSNQAKRWFVKPFLFLVDAFPIDPTNPMATKSLIEQAKENRKILIFPEGRLTVTGALMKIYEGTGMIVDKSGSTLLPIRIDGAQYTVFSRLKGKVRGRLFPKITLTILEPQKFCVNDNVKGRDRRNSVGEKLYDVMSSMMFSSSNYKRSLFQALLDAKAIHGGNHRIIEDINRNPLSYNQLITRCLILGKKLAKQTQKGDAVGVLLPNMSTTIITFFALQAYDRVPAMLNFSTGAANVASACKTAQLKIVYTSRNFIKMAELDAMVDAIKKENVSVVFIEDIGKSISIFDKFEGLVRGRLSSFTKITTDSNEAAVILFTSGSEGTPKGVVLSHQNLMANINQISSTIDFGPKDRVFNALPVFHSFGLTGGTLLPILSGINSFFYPSPLHYRIIPELVYDTNATIMFGTDTFLSGYANYAHAYDFYSVRYVFAGAEKLKEETRKLYSEKFGVRIFEGYGATETAPVLSTNTPMHSKSGMVGRLVPGIDYRLEPVSGIFEGGKLIVKGPNIMKGYLLLDNPGIVVPTDNGWYDTGDIVDIDDNGFITIKGRVKRFAKIAGEMVSLTAVETYLSSLWPEFYHAIVSISDNKKGEQLVLVTDCKEAERRLIVSYVKDHGISELSIPKQIIKVDEIPLLGTGKTDYVAIKDLVTT